MDVASGRIDERRRRHEVLAARLTALSDPQLEALLAGTNALRVNSHGNQAGVIEVDGAKVFVKKIALTDRERSPANERSTANVFDLPGFYQYGVGSAGFGAWRELSACLGASAWALSGECPLFPTVHHWRVLPRLRRLPLSAEQAAHLERLVQHWEGSDAVRARLEAIFAASATIVLFLEYVPQNLRQWLEARVNDRPVDTALEAAILRIGDQWREAAAFMNARGMLHFDLNTSNLLTDGEQVYVADFGLALCAAFDLSPAERAFFETHRLYDRCYVDWNFVQWLTPRDEPRDLTPALTRRLERCAPVAGAFGTFLDTVSKVSKTTPFPLSELTAALAAQSAIG